MKSFLQEKEQFKMHIDELLKLEAIKRSQSKHRSASFMLMKYSEVVRGKNRMVINYKHLNDNTNDR